MRVPDKKIFCFKIISIISLWLCISSATANSQINSIDISTKIISNFTKYADLKVNGVCIWLDCNFIPPHCKVYHTLELDEYLPDLIVSVYTNSNSKDKVKSKGKNSYYEASLLDDGAYYLGNTGFQYLVHSPAKIANGDSAAVTNVNRYDGLRSKAVSVSGSPFSLLHLPTLTLKPNTIPYFPYYYSDLDVFGKLGIAEIIRSETFTFGDFIGSNPLNPLNHWSYEFPRNMSVNVYNNYKAGAILAQRAADIVTNLNALHIVSSTTNSCGVNCIAANVIEEPKDDHEKWQMVYPNDKHVRIGEDDTLNPVSIGYKDDVKGDGNYIYVLWRHYQGCIQASGSLLYATHYYSPQKR